MIIKSSHGWMECDFSGNITNRSNSEILRKYKYADTSEFQRFLLSKNIEKYPSEIDILDIGLFDDDGGYYPPEPESRERNFGA